MCFVLFFFSGKILVGGGFDGFQFHNSTEIYDPNTDQWSLVGRLLNPRSGHCMATFDGQVFALGGFNGQERLRQGNESREVTFICYKIKKWVWKIKSEKIYEYNVRSSLDCFFVVVVVCFSEQHLKTILHADNIYIRN